MARGKRICPAGMVFHCLDRAVARLPLFEKEGDFEAFEKVLAEAHEQTPLRILDYTVMPNHWHFVVWPFFCRFSVLASIVFCVASVIFAHAWQRRFQRGPLESVMRKLID